MTGGVASTQMSGSYLCNTELWVNANLSEELVILFLTGQMTVLQMQFENKVVITIDNLIHKIVKLAQSSF